MILWDGEEMHDRPEPCWADVNGRECGAAATLFGLCTPCRFRLTPVDTRPNIR